MKRVWRKMNWKKKQAKKKKDFLKKIRKYEYIGGEYFIFDCTVSYVCLRSGEIERYVLIKWTGALETVIASVREAKERTSHSLTLREISCYSGRADFTCPKQPRMAGVLS